jgi:hypothetical protein
MKHLKVASIRLIFNSSHLAKLGVSVTGFRGLMVLVLKKKKYRGLSAIFLFSLSDLQDVVAEAHALAATSALATVRDKLAIPAMSFTEHRPARLDFFCYRLHD